MHISAAFRTTAGFAPRRAQPLDLVQTERAATAHFALMLRQAMGHLAATDRPVLLVVNMSSDLARSSARLIPVGVADAMMADGETAIAWSLPGVPTQQAKRRSLALRFASVAASTWRHRRLVERLDLVAV
ncbi:hypothetical protein ACLF3G_21905 [Falsiroseomonas sp. HC035]|uniref:hypothetical protein n=1 Tax=Falsiroseomonas sp. HC035 TaxID=3390999 RepID=UPI003D30F317